MVNNYRFLAHNIFINNLEEFKKVAESRDIKSLGTQYQKCISNPSQVGTKFTLKNLDLPTGFIMRLHVGHDRYRLICYVDPRQKNVLGIYISTVLKCNLDYDKTNWREIAANICTDYWAENYAVFSILQFTDVVE